MSKQLRIGIIGSGAMGQTHVKAWQNTSAKICGIVSKSEETAVPLAKSCGAKVFDSLDQLLPVIDVVDICVPTHLHCEITLIAAAAGVHVVCEKPLARNVSQAVEMIQACESAGVKLLAAHVVRFFPEYAQAKAKVVAGEIGLPAIIRLKRGASQPEKSSDNWFVDLEKSGGVILDLMIHDFDFARWIAGEVKTVYAKNIGTEHPGTSVDHALAILTHENGVLSHIEGSWAYPAPLFRTQLEIAGSNGLIQHNSDKTASIGSFFYQREQADVDVPLPASPMHEDPYATQIKAFYAHLTEDAPIPISARDGLAALKIALAALKSAQTGAPVDIQEMEVVS